MFPGLFFLMARYLVVLSDGNIFRVRSVVYIAVGYVAKTFWQVSSSVAVQLLYSSLLNRCTLQTETTAISTAFLGNSICEKLGEIAISFSVKL